MQPFIPILAAEYNKCAKARTRGYSDGTTLLYNHLCCF